jgi:HK97 gp10 family phage protein
MMTIGLEGLNKVKFQFQKWRKTPDDKIIEDEQLRNARKMQMLARARVQKRTGRLYRAIKAKKFKGQSWPGKPAVMFTVNRDILDPGWQKKSSRARRAYYDLMLEYGTRKMPSRPFFWPAVYAIKQIYPKNINRALKRAFRRNTR